jgi:CRP-like cAMP-binding protein
LAATRQDEIVDILASFALFADLSTPQLRGVAETFEEVFFSERQHVLHQGLSGSAFYLILDGDAAVTVDGQHRATLSRGDFFGEIAILLGEVPTADIIALTPLRCLALAAGNVQQFLTAHPPVMFRMLQALARRLRNANRWRS